MLRVRRTVSVACCPLELEAIREELASGTGAVAERVGTGTEGGGGRTSGAEILLTKSGRENSGGVGVYAGGGGEGGGVPTNANFVFEEFALARGVGVTAGEFREEATVEGVGGMEPLCDQGEEEDEDDVVISGGAQVP